MSTLSRRTFLASGIATGAAFSAVSTPHRSIAAATPVRYRELGKTGFKVSEIGFGCMNTRDPELIRAAIDTGINYLDTANGYMGGANEEVIGQVIAKQRDKVFLTTKIQARGASGLADMLKTSLTRLKTDHVDALLMHGVGDRNQVMNQELIDTFGSFRDKGLVRFIGVSTHSNMAAVLDAVVESKFWNIVCTSYNFTVQKEVTDAINRARAAGIAIVAMKTLQKGSGNPDGASATVTPNQAALKWVLSNKNVDTTVPGMSSFEHLAENMPVMGMKLTMKDERELRRYADNLKGAYCCGVSGCTGCQNQCPKGVALNDINRCLGYAYGYGDMRLAHENYKVLATNLNACSDCDECAVKCVNGLNLTDSIRRARTLFV
jgi:uncharacterized protein